MDLYWIMGSVRCHFYYFISGKGQKNSTIRKVNKKIVIISQMIDDTEDMAGRMNQAVSSVLYHRK